MTTRFDEEDDDLPFEEGDDDLPMFEEDEDDMQFAPAPSAQVERFERRIVKALTSHGSLPLSRLIDLCHVNRPRSGGAEKFNRALKALIATYQIVEIGKTKHSPVYELADG